MSTGIDCPSCGETRLRTIETRAARDGIRRRKECPACGARISTIEMQSSERERCAQLAQTHIPEGIHPDDLYRWRDTAGAIAAAIRTGN